MPVVVPTILCGGAGSRLWPISRELHPKPFMQLQDGESFLQKAFGRAAALPNVAEILTVTHQALFFKTQDEYKSVNAAKCYTAYVLEPFGRNTAAAIAAAALYIQKTQGDEAVMVVLPADHLIPEVEGFVQAVKQAIALASQDYLVTFGIQPTRPETGYGYIQLGEAVGEDGFQVKQFLEKPEREQAEQYCQTQGFVWNAGLFCFKVSAVLNAMQQYAKPILEAVQQTLAKTPLERTASWAQCRLDQEAFAQVPEDSFDYAVMEPFVQASGPVAVVCCDIGWKDIGSWRSFGELIAPDAAGNRVQGQAVLYETQNCYVQSSSRLVGVVGMQDMMVIDTPDALLVAHTDHAQNVKHIYNTLKQQGHEAYQLHRTVHRPWGTYTILEALERVKIKRIEVNPGASLSLQMHHHRSEHWIVVKGTAKVVNEDRTYLLRSNESTYIAAGHRHRLENPGIVTLIIIEVQCGDYLGEDDIIRFEDQYGRLMGVS